MSFFRSLSGNTRGAIWMTLGATFLVLLAITIRSLQDDYNVLQMIFMRSIISLMIVLPWALKQQRNNIRTKRLGLHWFRNIIHYVGNIGWFIAVTLLPLADLSAIQFTVPLFTICLAAIFLPEKIVKHRWIATIIGFVGALVIIRPGLIVLSFGTVAIILSSICYASSQVATKSLSKTDNPNTILLYMSIMFVLLSFVPACWVWKTPILLDILPIFSLGVLGYLAHACIIQSFSAADASFVMPFDFLRLPISAAFGIFLYDETLDPWVWIGAMIIFSATYYNTRIEHITERS